MILFETKIIRLLHGLFVNDLTSGGLFCCLRSSDRSSSRSPVRDIKPATMEMVEIAFRKFDRNGDGVLDWEEFQQVGSQGDHLIMMGYYNIDIIIFCDLETCT